MLIYLTLYRYSSLQNIRKKENVTKKNSPKYYHLEYTHCKTFCSIFIPFFLSICINTYSIYIHMCSCYELNVCVPPKFNLVEILTPKEMVLGGEAFERWLGHKFGALMNGINTLIKEIPEGQLALSVMWCYREKRVI